MTSRSVTTGTIMRMRKKTPVKERDQKISFFSETKCMKYEMTIDPFTSAIHRARLIVAGGGKFK